MKSLKERLEEKYEPEPNSGCWLWIGAINPEGYGRIYNAYTKKLSYAHRMSYELYKGEIPTGLQLDHLCRVPSCINPNHLEPVSNAENTKRGLAGKLAAKRNQSKTHCPKGHPYSGSNLYLTSDGRRDCRICRNNASIRWKMKKHMMEKMK